MSEYDVVLKDVDGYDIGTDLVDGLSPPRKGRNTY
jgi:hypothetical protein